MSTRPSDGPRASAADASDSATSSAFAAVPAATAADAAEPIGLLLADGGVTVGIDWADGHHSRYAAWYLRGLCPCAVCQGHGRATRFVADAPATTLADVLEVGHYALNLVWADGHRTGIYAKETLRRLCPCSACRLAQGAAHPFALVPEALRGRDATGGAAQQAAGAPESQSP